MAEVRRGHSSTGRRSRARMFTRRRGQAWKRQDQRSASGRRRRARRAASAVARPSPLGPTCFWMTWPEASAARSHWSLPSSRSMNLSPTWVRTKGMASPARASSRPALLMRVPTTPGMVSPRAERSWARSQRSWSPSTSSPWGSTTRHRSPSPSKAMPMAAPRSRTWAARPSRWVEPTPTLMRAPSAGTPIQWTVPPRKTWGAQGAVAPWAQSTTMENPAGRSRGSSWRMYSSGRAVSSGRAAGPAFMGPRASKAASTAASSSSASFSPRPSKPLMPLSSGGLWLAEIIRPQAPGRSRAA